MRRAGFLLGMMLTVLPALEARAETLSLVAEELAPINMSGPGEKKASGIATEVIEMAFADIKVPYTISFNSWSRSFEMALHDRNTCLFSASRTAEREPLFKWVGPIVKDRWVLFGRIDGPALTSLDDARTHSIGGHFDGASTRYLKGLGFQIDEGADYHSNLRRVEARQLDYAVSGLLTGAHAIAHDKGLTDIVPVFAFKDIDLYMACNKSVPDRIVERLNAVVERLSADGTVASIVRRYQ